MITTTEDTMRKAVGLLTVTLLITIQHQVGAAGQSPSLAPTSLPMAASSGSSNSTASVQGFIKVQGLEFVDGCGDRFQWAGTGGLRMARRVCSERSSLSTEVRA